MFWIKSNIVDQRVHKEGKESQGSEIFLKSHFLNTPVEPNFESSGEKSPFFLWNWYLCLKWCENLLPEAWKLQFPLVLTGTKCLMSRLSFDYCIHVSCMNILCMHIETTHHDIWHLTAQFSLTLLKLLLCWTDIVFCFMLLAAWI